MIVISHLHSTRREKTTLDMSPIAHKVTDKKCVFLAYRLIYTFKAFSSVNLAEVQSVQLRTKSCLRNQQGRIQGDIKSTRMWANVQPDGRPAKHRWRPLFNAAKFG